MTVVSSCLCCLFFSLVPLLSSVLCLFPSAFYRLCCLCLCIGFLIFHIYRLYLLCGVFYCYPLCLLSYLLVYCLPLFSHNSFSACFRALLSVLIALGTLLRNRCIFGPWLSVLVPVPVFRILLCLVLLLVRILDLMIFLRIRCTVVCCSFVHVVIFEFFIYLRHPLCHFSFYSFFH